MSETSSTDAVVRRRAAALAVLSTGLVGGALALLLVSEETRISGDRLLWLSVDPSSLTREPASFLSLLAVPIVVTALLAVLSGGNSPLLRKVAVVVGIAVAGVAVAYELDLVTYRELAEQVYVGIVPAGLLSLGLFGSALALAQASILSAHR